MSGTWVIHGLPLPTHGPPMGDRWSITANNPWATRGRPMKPTMHVIGLNIRSIGTLAQDTHG